MASTVWKGHLTFGLVSVPVRLIRAARAERVKLRQLYRPRASAPEREAAEPVRHRPNDRGRQDETPIRPLLFQSEAPVAPVQRVFHPASESTSGEAAPIEPTDLVKGYEYQRGQYVVLEDEDLRALAPQTSSEIQVAEFVNFEEIDPVYLETSYYIVPEESAEKAYALLFEAMRQSGYAAIGQLTMHRRDHMLIIRPGKTGLIGHTMFYPDEVRSTEEFRTNTSLVAPKELNLAKSLISALTQSFDPARFKNVFRERLNALIESRAAGREVARIEPRGPAKVVDIMDALKKSLAQAKGVSPAAHATRAERKPASPAKSSAQSRKRAEK